MESKTLITPAGAMPVFLFGEPTAPFVIMLMDAIGIRKEMQNTAQSLSEAGYRVALPDLYYRQGEHREMDLSAPGGMDTIMNLMATVELDGLCDDIQALIAAEAPAQVGLLGYCMGGAFSISLAGRLGEKVAAAAAIHPGGIVTDAPDSPHRQVSGIRGELYVAIADEDPYAFPEHVGTLESTLAEHQVDYTLETYKGAQHGFSFPSLPSYNRDAADRYWEAIRELFSRRLSAA